MASLSPESTQFCENIDRLIWEEENHMNNVNNNENSGDESRNNDPRSTLTGAPKKKIYRRCTFQQLDQLQKFFEKKSHPDENERATLARELRLSPERVKFWFQNKRSQTKKLTEKECHQQLKEENQKLSADNKACKNALLCAKCEKCNGSPDMVVLRNALLRIENAYIRDEIKRLKCMLQNHYGNGEVVPNNYPSWPIGPSVRLGLDVAGFEGGPELNAEQMFNREN